MRGAALSVAVLLAIAGGLAAYVYTAPPLPLSVTVNDAKQGAATVWVERSATFAVGFLVVVDADPLPTVATVIAVDHESGSLSLDTPLLGAAPARSTVALGEVATTMAVFDARVGLRRFPRRDSRTYAHAPAGMSREVMVFAADWAKVEVASPISGWAMAASSRVVHAGVVEEVAFSARTAVRTRPYEDEALVRWEGRVVTKTTDVGPAGGITYHVEAANIDGRRRVFDTTEAAWGTFRETDYIVDREGKGLTHADIPIGFTELGPPYEVLERAGDRVRIQWRDQGWVPRDSCRFDVRYNYSTTRRQDLSVRLRALLARL
jgi:hypothetical protein